MKVKLLVFVLLFTIFCNNNGNLERKVDMSKQITPVVAVNEPISNNTKNHFEQKVDSLRQIIPTVTGNQEFSFKEISENVWQWRNSQKFTQIDSITWVNNFGNPNPYDKSKYYDTNYYYKEIDFKDSLFNIVILQYAGGDRSNMYLVQIDKQGKPLKHHLLAFIRKHIADYEEVYSSIQENKITTYSHYEDYDLDSVKVIGDTLVMPSGSRISVIRDTVVTLW
jgi:hypothetical protein